MGTTALYKFRTPELGDLADGPLAFKNLADDVEKNMSNLRSSFVEHGTANNDDTGVDISANTNGIIMATRNYAVGFIGWCEIDFETSAYQRTGAPTPLVWAGNVRLYVNGVQVDSDRFHSRSLSLYQRPHCKAIIQVDAKLTTLAIRAEVNLDAASQTQVKFVEWTLSAKMIGAPKD